MATTNDAPATSDDEFLVFVAREVVAAGDKYERLVRDSYRHNRKSLAEEASALAANDGDRREMTEVGALMKSLSADSTQWTSPACVDPQEC